MSNRWWPWRRKVPRPMALAIHAIPHGCHAEKLWLTCGTLTWLVFIVIGLFRKTRMKGKTRCLQRSSRDHVSLPLLSQSSSVPSWWVRELRENERVPQAAIFFLYSRWLNFGIKYVLGCPSYLVNGAKRPQSRVPSTCRRLFSRGHVSKLSDMVSHGSY